MNNKLPISLFQQNMALLPDLRLPNGGNLYRGKEREKALTHLLSFLETHRPDLVGLSEMWSLGERGSLCEALAELYPYCLEGPGQANDRTLDGGLLLLSRFPIGESQSTIYPDCLGEDCLTKKGILLARIQLPGPAPNLNLFLTHLQNPDPFLASPNVGRGDSGRRKVQLQLDHLRHFIDCQRDPEMPALLMGDLNVDGRDLVQYDDLSARLGQPDDLWLTIGGSILTDNAEGAGVIEPIGGLTFDQQSTFALSAEQLATGLTHNPAPTRHRQGKRLDYFLSYQGEVTHSVYQNTRIVCLESSPGRDISDHYGLLTELVGWRPVDTNGPSPESQQP